MGSYELDGHTVKTSSEDRVVFPDCGVTKGDVIDYYARIADTMLPYVRERPLTMERFNKGIAHKGFYNKHAPKYFPAWIDRVEMPGKTMVEYAVASSAAAIVYIANQGTITFHVWTSRNDAPRYPDHIVFDLDPPEGRFDLVRASAHAVRGVLDEVGLPTYVKTSGSKGLHIVVPLDRSVSFGPVYKFCSRVAEIVCERHPDLCTTEFYKEDRGGRLFVDIGRNAWGATVVAPYSLRPRPGAPVAAPITWPEVDDPDLAADGFRIDTIFERLEVVGDLWGTFATDAVSLDGAIETLADLR